jgi:hypothetical protein
MRSALYHEGMLKSLKRWPVPLTLLVMLGALAVGLVFLPGGRVTRENCERIHEGMTEADVRAILGKPWDNSLLDPDPPGESDLEQARFLWALEEDGSSDRKAPAYSCFWVGSNLVLFVVFSHDGQVVSAEFSDRLYARSWLPGRVWRRLRARYGW